MSLNLTENKKSLVLKALNTSCCQRRAAERLGITWHTLIELKKKFGIERNERSEWVVKKTTKRIKNLSVTL